MLDNQYYIKADKTGKKKKDIHLNNYKSQQNEPVIPILLFY